MKIVCARNYFTECIIYFTDTVKYVRGCTTSLCFSILSIQMNEGRVGRFISSSICRTAEVVSTTFCWRLGRASRQQKIVETTSTILHIELDEPADPTLIHLNR